MPKWSGGGRVEFLPGLRVVGKNQLDGALSQVGPAKLELDGVDASIIDPLVLVSGADHLLEKHAEFIRLIVRRHQPLVITCIDRESLAALRGGAKGHLREIVPDIVVFDESFVNHAVPFAAFTARKIAVRLLESARQSHLSLDNLPAQYDFDPAFHALSGQG